MSESLEAWKNNLEISLKYFLEEPSYTNKEVMERTLFHYQECWIRGKARKQDNETK